MQRFELFLNEYGTGKTKIYNLLTNWKDQFLHFQSELDPSLNSNFKKITSTIFLLSEYEKSLPIGRINKIDGVDFGYEIKADKLRLYYLNFEDLGLLICVGGMKKNQRKDIAQFNKLSKEISNQIKEYGQLNIKQS